jgi:CubicO group peptidase (beta-lactamase class C family)
MRRLILPLILIALFRFAPAAQVPTNPAGQQFSRWLEAFNSGERVAMQQFSDKNKMPERFGLAQLEQWITSRERTGGFDVRNVIESTSTRLVVAAQERGGNRDYYRITMVVGATDPYEVTGLAVAPAQDLAPKLTAEEAESAKSGAPFRQLSAFLDALNSGDRARLQQIQATIFPTMNVDLQVNFYAQSGGLELRALEQANPTRIIGLVDERNSDRFGRLTLEVEPDEPHKISRLTLVGIPRPAAFAIPRMGDAELVSALREKLEQDAATDRFAGTVLLAKSGKVLFAAAYGLAEREKKVATTIDTQLRLGSMNKMFTATSILQLVQAGKIKLTDPLGKYVADYPNSEVAGKVTIHHLLTHTGGTGDIFGPELSARWREIKTHDDYITLYGKRAPAFEPGTRYAYSNYGMVLLGVVIERVSGQSYYDYVAEHIYKPAGMTLSGSEPENIAVPGRAIAYSRAGAGWTPAMFLVSRGMAAGGGYSTVGDLLKFSSALLEHKLLDASHTELLITGKVDTGGSRYAYGFVDTRRNGVGFVGHSGGAPGMSGDLRIYIPSGYVVAVLSNLDPPAAPEISGFIDARLSK